MNPHKRSARTGVAPISSATAMKKLQPPPVGAAVADLIAGTPASQAARYPMKIKPLALRTLLLPSIRRDD